LVMYAKSTEAGGERPARRRRVAVSDARNAGSRIAKRPKPRTPDDGSQDEQADGHCEDASASSWQAEACHASAPCHSDGGGAETDLGDAQLSWDPLVMAGQRFSGKDVQGNSAQNDILQEMRENMTSSRTKDVASPTGRAATTPQTRVQRKLEQRRAQRAAAAAAASAPAEEALGEPIDDSWIDEMEAEEAQKTKVVAKKEPRTRKSAKEKKAVAKDNVMDGWEISPTHPVESRTSGESFDTPLLTEVEQRLVEVDAESGASCAAAAVEREDLPRWRQRERVTPSVESTANNSKQKDKSKWRVTKDGRESEEQTSATEGRRKKKSGESNKAARQTEELPPLLEEPPGLGKPAARPLSSLPTDAEGVKRKEEEKSCLSSDPLKKTDGFENRSTWVTAGQLEFEQKKQAMAAAEAAAVAAAVAKAAPAKSNSVAKAKAAAKPAAAPAKQADSATALSENPSKTASIESKETIAEAKAKATVATDAKACSPEPRSKSKLDSAAAASKAVVAKASGKAWIGSERRLYAEVVGIRDAEGSRRNSVGKLFADEAEGRRGRNGEQRKLPESAAKVTGALGGADAPDFVPGAKLMVVLPQEAEAAAPQERGKKQDEGSVKKFSQDGNDKPNEFGTVAPSGDMATTLILTGIPVEYTQESLSQLFEMWGLAGTYDFLFLSSALSTAVGYGQALVNFTDPAFILLLQWLLSEARLPITAMAAEHQGLDTCLENFGQHCGNGDGIDPPLVVENPAPSLWAVNTTNELLSPQFREQFRKTKMCMFFQLGRCTRGGDCPFAHSQEDLQPAPDLAHTKLCSNYFRGNCTDVMCRYAHGSHELRVSCASGVVTGFEDVNWYFDPSAWALGGAAWWPMQVQADQNEVEADDGLQAASESEEDVGHDAGVQPQDQEQHKATEDLAGLTPTIDVKERANNMVLASCCPTCGSTFMLGWKFCSSCGSKRPEVPGYMGVYSRDPVPGNWSASGSASASSSRAPVASTLSLAPVHVAAPPAAPPPPAPLAPVMEEPEWSRQVSDGDDGKVPCISLRRSWSEGDLEAFREAMEENDPLF